MAKNFTFAFNIDGKLGPSFESAVKSANAGLLRLHDESKFVRHEQKRLNLAYDSGAVSMSQYTERARALEQELRNIKDSQARVSALLEKQQGAKNAFSGAVDSLILTKTAIAGMAQPLIGAVQTAAKFEAAMSKVGAITNADAADMRELTDAARELGEKTQFSASQSAEAMQYLGMAGWKTKEIIAGMPGLLNLAAAGGTSLAKTADIISDDLTAFGLEADKAAHMADVFAYTITNSNTNVEMMGETMKYAAPVAQAFGATMEETAALTGLMANSGIKASQAGTALRSGFLRLAGPPKAARKAMDALGMSLSDITQEQKEAELALKSLGIEMSNTNGPKKMANILAELKAKTADLGKEEKLATLKAIFGTEAATGWLAVLDAGPEKFAAFTAALEKSDGAAANMASKMQNNAQGAATRLQSAMESLSISIGTTFLPALADVTDKGARYAAQLSQIAAAHPALIRGTVEAAAAVAGLVLAYKAGKVVYTGINLVKATYNLLTDAEVAKDEKAALSKAVVTVKTFALTTAQSALNTAKAAGVAIENGHAIASARAVAAMAAQKAATVAATAAQWALNVALNANPIGAAIIAIAALTAAGYALRKNWGTITEYLAQSWGKVTGAVSNAAGAISQKWEAVTGAISGAWAKAKTAIASNLQHVKTSAYGALNAVAKGITELPEKAAYAVGYAIGYIETLPQRIAYTATNAAIYMGELANNAIQWGANTLDNFVTGVKALPERLMQLVDETQAAGAALIANAQQWGINALESLINGIITLPDRVIAVIESTATAGQQFIQGAGQWGKMAIDELIKYFTNLPNKLANIATNAWERAKAAFSTGKAVAEATAPNAAPTAIAANAKGGIYAKGAFLSTLAEDSPEAVIPIVKGDKRAETLYQKTGELLGVDKSIEPMGANPDTVAHAKAATLAPEPAIAAKAATVTQEAQKPKYDLLDKLTGFISGQKSRNTTNTISTPINFAPVINVQGNATQDTVNQIAEQVQAQCEALLQKLQQMQSQERRLSYE